MRDSDVAACAYLISPADPMSRYMAVSHCHHHHHHCFVCPLRWHRSYPYNRILEQMSPSKCDKTRLLLEAGIMYLCIMSLSFPFATSQLWLLDLPAEHIYMLLPASCAHLCPNVHVAAEERVSRCGTALWLELHLHWNGGGAREGLEEPRAPTVSGAEKVDCLKSKGLQGLTRQEEQPKGWHNKSKG